MVELIARIAHVYGGRRRRAGERYAARNARDARLMVALGRAEVYQPAPFPDPPPAPPAYDAAFLAQATGTVAAPEPEPEAPAEAVPAPRIRPGRRYRRRDLRADE